MLQLSAMPLLVIGHARDLLSALRMFGRGSDGTTAASLCHASRASDVRDCEVRAGSNLVLYFSGTLLLYQGLPTYARASYVCVAAGAWFYDHGGLC